MASATGGHRSGDGITTTPLNTVTIVSGPRYTIGLYKDRIAVFGGGLIGEVSLGGCEPVSGVERNPPDHYLR